MRSPETAEIQSSGRPAPTLKQQMKMLRKWRQNLRKEYYELDVKGDFVVSDKDVCFEIECIDAAVKNLANLEAQRSAQMNLPGAGSLPNAPCPRPERAPGMDRRPWWQKKLRGAVNPPPHMGLPWQQFCVSGRNHFVRHEIGYFFGRTPFEAIAECRRRKGHLCGGLKLEAEARL